MYTSKFLCILQTIFLALHHQTPRMRRRCWCTQRNCTNLRTTSGAVTVTLLTTPWSFTGEQTHDQLLLFTSLTLHNIRGVGTGMWMLEPTHIKPRDCMSSNAPTAVAFQHYFFGVDSYLHLKIQFQGCHPFHPFVHTIDRSKKKSVNMLFRIYTIIFI